MRRTIATACNLGTFIRRHLSRGADTQLPIPRFYVNLLQRVFRSAAAVASRDGRHGVDPPERSEAEPDWLRTRVEASRARTVRAGRGLAWHVCPPSPSYGASAEALRAEAE